MAFTLIDKLKAHKSCLKVCNKEEFGNMEFKNTSCMDKLEAWELKEGVVDLSPEKLGSKMLVYEEHGEILRCRDAQFFQRSRVDWIE